MKQETHTPNILRKLIDLPLDTAAGLALLAAKKGTGSTKKYMEQVLIAHEKKNSKRNSKGQLI